MPHHFSYCYPFGFAPSLLICTRVYMLVSVNFSIQFF